MDTLIDKVWDTIGKWPAIPWPSLISFVVVTVLLLPHIIKLFRQPKAEAPAHEPQPTAPAPALSAEMPWLLTNVVNADRNTQEILHMLRTADGQSRIDVLNHKIDVIDKMLRRRSGRSKKLGKNEPGEGL